MSRLLELAMTFIPPSGFKATRSSEVDEIVVWTVVGVYVKALKTFRAIQIVSESGLTQDAIALLRVLFETTVTILFLLQKNSRLRARMYQARIYVKHLTLLRTWKTRKGLKRNVKKADLRDAEALLLKILAGFGGLSKWPANHWYGLKLPAAIEAMQRARQTKTEIESAERDAIEAIVFALRDHWSGRSIWDAANSLRWMTAYETLYRYTTFFSHAEDYHKHVEIKTDGGMLLKLIPSADAETVRTMEPASMFLWSLMSEIEKRFKVGKETELEAAKPAIVTRAEALHGRKVTVT
jgi:Family of unknown function (DUF5677)